MVCSLVFAAPVSLRSTGRYLRSAIPAGVGARTCTRRADLLAGTPGNRRRRSTWWGSASTGTPTHPPRNRKSTHPLARWNRTRRNRCPTCTRPRVEPRPPDTPMRPVRHRNVAPRPTRSRRHCCLSPRERSRPGWSLRLHRRHPRRRPSHRCRRTRRPPLATRCPSTRRHRLRRSSMLPLRTCRLRPRRSVPAYSLPSSPRRRPVPCRWRGRQYPECPPRQLSKSGRRLRSLRPWCWKLQPCLRNTPG
jgi:hypothetical protein